MCLVSFFCRLRFLVKKWQEVDRKGALAQGKVPRPGGTPAAVGRRTHKLFFLLFVAFSFTFGSFFSVDGDVIKHSKKIREFRQGSRSEGGCAQHREVRAYVSCEHSSQGRMVMGNAEMLNILIL